MQKATDYFNELNRDYLKVHKTKEDLFWSTYMGTSDDQQGFAEAESAYKEFVSNATRIGEIKELLTLVEAAVQTQEKQDLLQGLRGWLAFFECNSIESPEGKKLLKELIAMESEMFTLRKNLSLSYTNEKGEVVEASTLVLRSNLKAHANEAVRQSSHEGFLALESWVVNHGFIELVQLRNRFARTLGYKNFFDYKVRSLESMSPEKLFEILDDFEEKTREANLRSLKELAAKKGDQALAAHNLNYYVGGDVEQQLDPYMPFSKSLERWTQSFKALGVDYKEAKLTLDLLDRKGKYENGFMHGPVPCFYNQGQWQPATINFTSNANPNQIGSGYDALNTLFHEGGHAAHYSNVTLNAPCFSQEFLPSSMALAETQSMFCDSLLGDADWLKTYAKDSNGMAIPDELLKAMIDAKQPFSAYQERSILVVPYFEWALYSMEEETMTSESVIALAREMEKRILGIDCSPRPLLAIPHLLSHEPACAYHGYLLAHMAVYQTRAWFKKEHGYLTDNPVIGPLLAEHYWNPGNKVSHDDTLVSLTGEGFSAAYLAQTCNRTVDEAWKEAKELMAMAEQRPTQSLMDCSLNAQIRVVQGDELIADNLTSDEAMLEKFEAWVEEHYNQ